MPKIGNFVCNIYVEQSQTIAELNKRLCAARKDFKIIPLDKTGVRRGEEYSYWSINAFRESIVDPLAKHGITWDVRYTHNDMGTFAVATLTYHDEWKSSTLPVPAGFDMQDDKAWKTTIQKELADAMLQPRTENAEDEERQIDGPAVAGTQAKWEENLASARAKIGAAKTREESADLLDKAAIFIQTGRLSPDCMTELRALSEERFPTGSKEEPSA